MKEQIFNQLNMFVWAKDKYFRYVFCNERYAEAAGLDSPHQIIGKGDENLPWRKFADYFKVGDYGVLQGKCRLNSAEVTDTVNNVTDILVSESQLLSSNGKCIGVVGSFVDITGRRLIKKTGSYNKEKNRFYLGEEDFNNVYLASREIDVFKKILLGYSAKQIADVLKISPKTVESYIDSIKLKLQAKSKGEIIATAIQFGLTHILYL